MLEFTASGYIEVTREGSILSRHRQEREALQACARFGPGEYLIRYPEVRVVVTGTATGTIAGEAHAA